MTDEDYLTYLIWIVLLLLFVLALVLILRKRSREDRERAEQGRFLTVDLPTRFINLCRKSRIPWDPERSIVTFGWTSLGGHGWAPPERTIVGLGVTDEHLVISDAEATTIIRSLPWNQVYGLDTTGPGAVTTNAGIIGGGFGVWGAIKGIAAAEVINRVTSRTTVNSFVAIQGEGGGTVLHTSYFTPDQLRIMFSPAYGSLAKRLTGTPRSGTADAIEQLERLVKLKEAGALSDEEFEAMRRRLLTGD
jgi:hypothetical protein